jgi:hypothetical protein
MVGFTAETLAVCSAAYDRRWEERNLPLHNNVQNKLPQIIVWTVKATTPCTLSKAENSTPALISSGLLLASMFNHFTYLRTARPFLNRTPSQPYGFQLK